MIQEVDELKGTQEYQEMLDEIEFSEKQLHIIEVQTMKLKDMIVKPKE